MLSPTNIEMIRRYFLASDSNEFQDIQKEISQASYYIYLSEMKSMFNRGVAEVASLASIAKTMDASENMNELLEIQRDYYALQAELFNANKLNSDTETLLKNGNSVFLKEIEFQKELKHAFFLTEKNELKKRFQLWDKELAEQKDDIKAQPSFYRRLQPTSRLKKWKQVAAAAAVLIGIIILPITFILLKRPAKKSDIPITIDNTVSKDTQEMREIFIERDFLQKQLNNLITDATKSAEQERKSVLKEKSLGFASKQEKITIRIYELGTKYSNNKNLLETTASQNLSSNQESIVRNDSISLKLIYKIDSIQRLSNNFKFIKDTLSLFVRSKGEIEDLQIIQIKSEYYLRINDNFYQCQQSTKPLPLKPISENAILKRLETIISLNSK